MRNALNPSTLFRRVAPGALGVVLSLLLLGASASVSSAQSEMTQENAVDLSNSFDLMQLVRLAEERNLGLAQSAQDVRTAEGSYKSSRSALLPTLRMGLSHSQRTFETDRLRTNNQTGELVGIGRSVQKSNSLSLGGQVNLVDMPSIYGYRQSESSLEASREGFERSRLGLQYDIVQLYYALIKAQELVRVNTDAHALSEEQLARSQALYELGSVARSDVLQAKVNLASADRDLISSRNAVDQERARVALALGLPVTSDVQVADPPAIPADIPTDESALVSEAMQNRPDLRQAELNLEAASLGVKSAEWARWPNLTGNYSYGSQTDKIDLVFNKADDDYNYGWGLAVNWNVFDGLNTKGNIQRAKADRMRRQWALEEQRLNITLDVRTSMIEIKNATESIESARESVEFSEESVKLQQALYESGGGTLLEWNNSQVELTRSKQSLVEAEVDLRLALAGLRLAVGGPQ